MSILTFNRKDSILNLTIMTTGVSHIRLLAFLLQMTGSLIISLPSFPDFVKIQDGSVLMGTIVNMADDKILLTTAYAGDVSIPKDQIDEIETNETKPVHLTDGNVIEGIIKTKGSKSISIIHQDDQTETPIELDQITAIAPPSPPAPQPVQWTGKIVGNFSGTNGNSFTEAFGLDGNAEYRTDNDRISFETALFYSENEGKTDRDDQYLSGKYDYFFTNKLFGFFNTRLDRDTMREIDLRSTGGSGLGYQFLESGIFNLYGESGISVVDEIFKHPVNNKTYTALRVAGHFNWWFIKDRLQFNQNAEYLQRINNTDFFIANTDSTLSWKWTDRWSLDGGLRFDYDNSPAAGIKRSGAKYQLGIGYSF